MQTTNLELPPPSVDFGIELFATQVENEEDSFGNDYDKPAPLPTIPEKVNATATGTISSQGGTITSSDGKVSAIIPANTFTDNTNVTIDVETTSTAAESATYNIDVTVGDSGELETGKPIKVELNIEKGLKNVKVTHNPDSSDSKEEFTAGDSAADLTNKQFFYDINSGKLTICSDSFSPFKIDFETPDYEAEYNNVLYNNFEEAVADAEAGGTVTLLKNVDDGAGIAIDKNITIDFGGHTYVANEPYVGSKGTETLGFQLLKGNSVTFKNGKLTMNAGSETILIQNYADLTLENMEIVAGANTYAVSINNGTVSIKDCVITGEGNTCPALDVMHWHDNYATPTVTLTNTIINGKADIYCYKSGEDKLTDCESKPVVNFVNCNNNYTVVVPENADFNDVLTTVLPGNTIVLPENKEVELTESIPTGVTIIGNGVDSVISIPKKEGVVAGANSTLSNVVINDTAKEGANYTGTVNLNGDGAKIESSVINGSGSATWDAAVAISLKKGETAYITDTTINGGFRGVFMGSTSGNVVIDNCVINPKAYTISVDGGSDINITVTNSTLKGWLSYSNSATVSYDNCKLASNGSYAFFRPYSATTLTNCDFETGYEIDASKAPITLTNCTIGGVALTIDNASVLFGGTIPENVTIN